MRTMINRSLKAILGVKHGIMACVGRYYLRLIGVELGSNLNMISLPVCRKHANARIRIGNNVIIRNRIQENLAGAVHPTVIAAVDENALIDIGNDTGISSGILYSVREIRVGSNVLIGVGARLFDTDFHPIGIQDRRLNRKSAIESAPIVIEDDAWIGAGAIVLKGVTIGKGTVVAAGSVVTKSFGPGLIVGGVPAKVIRSI